MVASQCKQKNHGMHVRCRDDKLGLNLLSAPGSGLQFSLKSENFFRDFIEVDLVLAVGNLIAKLSHA